MLVRILFKICVCYDFCMSVICLCGKFGDYIICRCNCVRLILDRWRNIFIRIEDMKNEKGKSEKDRLVKYY